MEDKKYDCLTCPYPRYKTPELIYCDVCIRRIMDKHKAQINNVSEVSKIDDTHTR